MASAPPPLTACVFTHRGAVRDHNEDAVAIGGCTLAAIDFSGTHSVNADGPIVVAVADGLGGHAAGEVASTHTVYRLAQLAGHMNTPNGITQVLREISDEIYTIHGAGPHQRTGDHRRRTRLHGRPDLVVQRRRLQAVP